MLSTRRGALPVVVLFLFASVACAQEALTNASLGGRVTDSSGAVLPGTRVVAEEQATHQETIAVTDASGRFRFPYLHLGRYTLQSSHAGFAPAEQTLQLSLGAAFELSFTLQIQGASTSVQVPASPPLIEAARSQIAATVSQAEATELPYSGRNYLDLALLAPGVSPTNTNSVQTFAETSALVGQGYSVSSQRNFSNSFIVDGLSANDDAAGLAGDSYGLDAVREFQVVTSGGQAEFGRALGGYFNVVTRSGSNDPHGTVYGFLRNQRLNATNALTQSRLPATQGQYGGSLSGPLQHDRSFAFGNFEQLHLNSNGIIRIRPADAAAIDQRLLATGYRAPLLPLGTGASTLYPTTVHTNTALLRFDARVSDRDQFTARYSAYTLDSLNARGVGSLAAVSSGTALSNLDHTVALSNIRTITAHTVNETRAQFAYDSLSAPPNDAIGPAVNIAGVAQFGRFSSSPTARRNLLFEAVDNLVMERGVHTAKAGIDVLHNADRITFPQSLRGAYTFASLSAFLAGTYNTQGYTQSFGSPEISQGNPNVGLYAQDEWKVSRALTLNAGVRYDLQLLRTISTDANNVSPRLGLAWSPFGRQGTVIRASYGFFYDRVPLRALANALLSASNSTDPQQAQLLSYTFSPGQAGAPAFPAVASAPPSGALLNYTLMNRHLQNAVSQQASLEFEQQLSGTTTVAVSYQHLRGAHLLASINTNINRDGTRPDPTFGNSKVYDSKADSGYDALSVSLVQRPVRWGSLRLSYTWSKALDNVGEFFFSAPVNNFDLNEDRGRSDDDQRHRVVADAILHTAESFNGGARARLLHGWSLSGILQYYSALPFNVTTGATSLQGTALRPCLAAPVTLACREALPGTLLGRNTGVGFDLFTLNSRLSRVVPVRDHIQAQISVEAFNLLNHRNDMIPNGTWGTGAYPAMPGGSFGQSTAVGDPRGLQVAARLSF